MDRDFFRFYNEWFEAITCLPKELQGEVYVSIFDYAFYGVIPTSDNSAVDFILQMVKYRIDVNNMRYINGCKGGAPKGNQNAKKGKSKTTKNNQNFFDVTHSNNSEFEENDLCKKTTKNNQNKTVVCDEAKDEIEKTNLLEITNQELTKNGQNFPDVTHSNNSEFGKNSLVGITNQKLTKNNQNKTVVCDDDVMSKEKEKEKVIKEKEKESGEFYNLEEKEKNKKEKEQTKKEMEDGNYEKFLKWVKVHTPKITKRYGIVSQNEMFELINVYGKIEFFDALRSAEEDFIKHSIFQDDNLYEILYDKLERKNRKGKKPLSNNIPLFTEIIDADTSRWSDEEYLDKLYPHLMPNNPYRLTKRVLDREIDDKNSMRALLKHIRENGEKDNEPKRDFLKYRYCVEMVREYYNTQLIRFGNHLVPWDNITSQQMNTMRRRLYVIGLDGVKHSIDVLVRNRLISETELNYKSSRGVNWILDNTKFSELMNGVYDIHGYEPLEPLDKTVDVSSKEISSISRVDSPNFVDRDEGGIVNHNEG